MIRVDRLRKAFKLNRKSRKRLGGEFRHRNELAAVDWKPHILEQFPAPHAAAQTPGRLPP